MTVFRGREREIDAERLAIAEQFARYGLAECCACRRFLPKRYLGPVDPEGKQRCANWSDCRDARAMAEAFRSQDSELVVPVDVQAEQGEELELVSAR